MNICSQPWCYSKPQYSALALCFEHARPHMVECEARKVNPFVPPAGTLNGGRYEMRFNKTKWLWWRGCWRLVQKGTR